MVVGRGAARRRRVLAQRCRREPHALAVAPPAALLEHAQAQTRRARRPRVRRQAAATRGKRGSGGDRQPLDALLVWLTEDRAHVERYLTTPRGVAQLSVVMEARSHASFVNMLDALSKIVYASPPANRALGRIDPSVGLSPFVKALIARLSPRPHPDARVRLLLLRVLTNIYERHQAPKQLVKLHGLVPLLERIKTQDPGVLVIQVASDLYEAFKSHDIL